MKKSITIFSAFCSYIFAFQIVVADTSTSPQASPFSSTPTTVKKTELPPPKKEVQGTPFKPLPKPSLPVMAKPFGMPGVVGWQNGKWEGSDYLGYLSSNISISVEILKGENVPNTSIDEGALESRIREIFTKESLNPQAVVTEGPPLPFLHVLILVYALDKEKFVIFASARLFEQIDVKRTNFTPAGYWQGITWEHQEILTAAPQDLDTQLKSIADKIAKDFTDRYRQYNPTNPEAPTKSSGVLRPSDNTPLPAKKT